MFSTVFRILLWVQIHVGFCLLPHGDVALPQQYFMCSIGNNWNGRRWDLSIRLSCVKTNSAAVIVASAQHRRAARGWHTSLSQARIEDDNSNHKTIRSKHNTAKNVFLVTLVDQFAGLFASKTGGPSVPVPLGFILVWSVVAITSSTTQFIVSLVLFAGSRFILDELRLEEYDDDDEYDMKLYDGESERRNLRKIREQQQSESNRGDAFLSSFTMGMPPAPSMLQDIFCFFASLALGAILTASVSSQPTILQLVTQWINLGTTRNQIDIKQYLMAWTTLFSPVGCIGALVAVGVSMVFWNKQSKMGKTGEVTTKDTYQMDQSSNSVDRRDPRNELLNLWDERLERRIEKESLYSQQKGVTNDEKNPDS